MTNKELLENIIIDCEYLGKDKATIDIETIKSIEKDLEVLDKYKRVMCEPIKDIMKDLEKLELYEKVFPKMQEDGAYYKGQYYKQQEILEILKEKAYFYPVNGNPKVASIQINITTLDVNFNEIKEWLNNDK